MVSKTTVTPEKYALDGGGYCPKCGSEEYELHGDNIFICKKCGCQWMEEYELTGYWIVVEEDPATATYTREAK